MAANTVSQLSAARTKAPHLDHFLQAETRKSSAKVILFEGSNPQVTRLDNRFVVSSAEKLNEQAVWEAITRSLAETPDTKRWKLCGRTERIDRILLLEGFPKCWKSIGEMNQISHHLDLEAWKPIASATWHSDFNFGPALTAEIKVTAELFYGFFDSVQLPDMDLTKMTAQDFIGSATSFIHAGNVFLLRAPLEHTVVGMVGVVATWVNPANGRKCGRLALIYTPSEYRGKGFATLAMNHMLRVLQSDRGYQDLYLFTDVTKPAPNKLYKGLGFKPLEKAVLRVIEAL